MRINPVVPCTLIGGCVSYEPWEALPACVESRAAVPPDGVSSSGLAVADIVDLVDGTAAFAQFSPESAGFEAFDATMTFRVLDVLSAHEDTVIDDAAWPDPATDGCTPGQVLRLDVTLAWEADTLGPLHVYEGIVYAREAAPEHTWVQASADLEAPPSWLRDAAAAQESPDTKVTFVVSSSLVHPEGQALTHGAWQADDASTSWVNPVGRLDRITPTAGWRMTYDYLASITPP